MATQSAKNEKLVEQPIPKPAAGNKKEKVKAAPKKAKVKTTPKSKKTAARKQGVKRKQGGGDTTTATASTDQTTAPNTKRRKMQPTKNNKKKPNSATTKSKKKKAGTAPRKKKPLPSRRSIIRAPRSTWINFLTTKRNENLPENANLSFGQLCKKLSPIWRNMSDEEKLPFTKQYQKDRARFVQEVKLLTKEQKRVLRAHRRLRKKKKQGKPRTPLSAYMFFVSNERAKVIELVTQDFKEVGRELGRRWRALSAEDRNPYILKAKEDRARYEKEVEVFNKAKVEAKAAAAAEKASKSGVGGTGAQPVEVA